LLAIRQYVQTCSLVMFSPDSSRPLSSSKAMLKQLMRSVSFSLPICAPRSRMRCVTMPTITEESILPLRYTPTGTSTPQANGLKKPRADSFNHFLLDSGLLCRLDADQLVQTDRNSNCVPCLETRHPSMAFASLHHLDYRANSDRLVPMRKMSDTLGVMKLQSLL
jgi:hypothetical protein